MDICTPLITHLEAKVFIPWQKLLKTSILAYFMSGHQERRKLSKVRLKFGQNIDLY